MNNGNRNKFLVYLMVMYIAVFSSSYYSISGKPYSGHSTSHLPSSYYASIDQSLFVQGREGGNQSNGENNFPVFDSKKHRNSLLNAQKYFEMVNQRVISIHIDFSERISKTPSISDIIFPFDYFW